MKRIVRSRHRILGGVCGGIGEYLGIDPTIVRLIWAVLTFGTVGGWFLIYFLAWVLIPEEGYR